ncbi:hypothetical protein CWO84_06645 [Methylomonas sp. Kb3]|nr:hypothetical protein CWO84_06645 [Methylomonas sp. Kb3]
MITLKSKHKLDYPNVFLHDYDGRERIEKTGKNSINPTDLAQADTPTARCEHGQFSHCQPEW